MTAIWFTSDLHIGHIKVAELRGFTSTAEHDAVLAANWDRTVAPSDQIWVLGDVSGNRGSEPAALEWISQRPGTKHLIAGNHDACHPLHREAHKAQRDYLRVFASVQQSAVRRIDGLRVLLCHFPYAGPDGDHTTVLRYPEYRFPDTGRPLLHGHTHSEIAVRGHQLHVGVDAHHLTPVSLHWVETQLRQAHTTTPHQPPAQQPRH